jgi:hypothetical protein
MSPAYSITIDAAALAGALQITEEQTIAAFRDGRVSSRFAEYWAASMFGLVLYENKNHRSSDGYYQLPDRSKIEVSIRTLTARGIKFQDSKFMGGGRSCSLDDLKASIRRTDQWRIINVANFPIVEGYAVKCSVLEHWIDAGELTPSGLSYDGFAELMNREPTLPMLRQLTFEG